MKRFIRFGLPAIVALLLIFIDQFTKYLIDTRLGLHNSIPLWENVFEIHYIRNTGTAWGLLAGQQTFFRIITVVLIIAMISCYIFLSRQKKFLPLNCALVLLFAGAIGNFIDRLRFGYVIDFLYFKLINFPVFNVADMYVVISMFVLSFLILFYYKDEDFDFKRKD